MVQMGVKYDHPWGTPHTPKGHNFAFLERMVHLVWCGDYSYLALRMGPILFAHSYCHISTAGGAVSTS